MTSKLNRCWFDAVDAGMGDFVVSAAHLGSAYLTPAQANAVDAETYFYIAEYGSPPTEWEIGGGAYTVSSVTGARTKIVGSSNGGAKVDFTGAPNVRYGVPLGLDWPGRENKTTLATDHSTAAPIDVNFWLTEVTTDGSGIDNEVSLPSLTVADAGRTVALNVTFGDPSDKLFVVGTNVAPLLDSNNLYFQQSINPTDHIVFRWSGFQWDVVGGYMIDDQSNRYVRTIESGLVGWTSAINLFSGLILGQDWTFYGTDSTGNASFLDRNPNDIDTEETVDLALTDGISNTLYLSRMVSDNTGVPKTFFLSNGRVTGQRKLIKLETQSDPGDVSSLDPANVVDDADAQPASIDLDAVGEEFFIEWQGYRNGGSGKWVIVGASTGVVTP